MQAVILHMLATRTCVPLLHVSSRIGISLVTLQKYHPLSLVLMELMVIIDQVSFVIID